MTIPQEIMTCFEELNPRAAALLSFADTSGVRLLPTAGAENIYDARNKEAYYLHDPNNPEKEAIHWWSSIDMKRVECLVIFGIGAGWPWKAILSWLQLKKERRVIILEDDIAVLSCFLRSSFAPLFFQDKQSTLLYLEDGEEGRRVIELVSWYLYQRPYKVVASPSKLQREPNVFAELCREISTEENNVKSVLDEFFTFGEGQLRNFGRNLFFWQKSLQGASLFNQFRGCPAIVVAAGPSLDKDIELLQKVQSSALVLAGGSSIGALLQGGVIPHFTASVDPNPAQYSRMRQAEPFCLPLFYRSRALFEGLFLHKGPLLYLRGGDGYPIVDLVEKSLGVTGKTLDGGDSVSNLLIELAVSLGCDPIIMVGYDLAYTNGARYAKNVSESLRHGEEVAFTGATRGQLVEGEAQDGTSVTTEVKWVTESKWIERFCNDYPHVHLINTAEHGLKISGPEVSSFADAVSKYCTPTRDIEGLVHLALQEGSKIPFSLPALSRAVFHLSKTMERATDLLQKIEEIAKGCDDPEEHHEIVELTHTLEQEDAFRYVLLPFSMMHQKLSLMRSFFESRPFGDEAARQAYLAKAFIDRCQFLLKACKAHQRFFFSTVSWGWTIGYPLPEALSLAPMPEEFASIPKELVS
jgi:hypothetical protein